MRVGTHTLGLRKICEMYDDMPSAGTISQWRYKYDWFSAQYARAKLKQADLLAEDILDIANDGRNDWMETLSDDEKGAGWRLNGEHVQRSRLRIRHSKMASL